MKKKNFSHERFINYENLGNTCSIYFKQKTTTKYEKELLKYLGSNNIIIESIYDGILAEFDLLIASQFIIYYIWKAMNLDVSKPKYYENDLSMFDSPIAFKDNEQAQEFDNELIRKLQK